MKRTIELTDPRTLRALAHPTRLALVGLLRQHGSLTATQAAALLGLNSGSCSFHLRQLAKYGLVEEVETRGRQKPWRATAQSTSWPSVTSEPEMAAAVQLLSSVVVERYADLMLQWVRNGASEPEEWQRAAWLGDLTLHLTAAELTALTHQLETLIAPYQQRVLAPEQRPAGSRLVTMIHAAIPRGGRAPEAAANAETTTNEPVK